MAITVTTGVTTLSTTNTNSYATASFTPAASDQLIAFVVASDTLANGAMTDSQSLGWTRRVFQTWNGGTSKLYIFVANTLAAASSMTATFTCTGDNATGCLVHIVRVAGAPTPAGTYVQVASNADDTQGVLIPSVTMGAAVNTNNCVIVCAVDTNNPSAIDEPSGFTEHVDSGFNNPSIGFEAAYKISGTTSTTINWQNITPTTQSWATAAIELGPSGGGGSTHLGTSDVLLRNVINPAGGRVMKYGSDLLFRNILTSNNTVTFVAGMKSMFGIWMGGAGMVPASTTALGSSDILLRCVIDARGNIVYLNNTNSLLRNVVTSRGNLVMQHIEVGAFDEGFDDSFDIASSRLFGMRLFIPNISSTTSFTANSNITLNDNMTSLANILFNVNNQYITLEKIITGRGNISTTHGTNILTRNIINSLGNLLIMNSSNYLQENIMNSLGTLNMKSTISLLNRLQSSALAGITSVNSTTSTILNEFILTNRPSLILGVSSSIPGRFISTNSGRVLMQGIIVLLDENNLTASSSMSWSNRQNVLLNNNIVPFAGINIHSSTNMLDELSITGASGITAGFSGIADLKHRLILISRPALVVNNQQSILLDVVSSQRAGLVMTPSSNMLNENLLTSSGGILLGSGRTSFVLQNIISGLLAKLLAPNNVYVTLYINREDNIIQYIYQVKEISL